MPKSLHVYVCSSYRDLVNERKAISDGLDKLSAQYQSFTFTCTKSIQPLKTCCEEIHRSQILVLMVGHLQGVLAPGQEISYGESEYNLGIAQGKQVLVYFRDEKTGIYPNHFERDANRIQQLKAFKAKLVEKHQPKIFTDLASLVALLNQDMIKVASEMELEGKPSPPKIRFKVVGEDHKKSSTINRPIVQPLPSTPAESEYSTHTIPLYQKALATPFNMRTPGMGRTSKGLLLLFLLVIISTLALSEFRKRFQSKPNKPNISSILPAVPGFSSFFVKPHVSPNSATPSDSISTPPVAPLLAGPQITAPSVPAAPSVEVLIPQEPISSVLLMDDTDTSAVLLRKAQNGSTEDQLLVGQMYEEGKGVPANDSIAFRWYRRSAEQGSAEAQYRTAMMYRSGKGTVRSSYQAARWFQAAAEQGLSQAQVKLGQLYRTGKGVVRNETTAFRWFLKAAEQKNPDAEKILAELKEE